MPAAVGHPIVDADGHIVEFMPAVLPYLREALGSAAFDRYVAGRTAIGAAMAGRSLAERRRTRIPQSPWWGTPARQTRDFASSLSPRLLHERLEELGFSYSVLYPTNGMGSAGVTDDELRAGLCRGFNDFYADIYGPFADRLTVAGLIPMNTPAEAIAELEHCKQIGLKVVGIPNGVLRPIADPAPSPWLVPGQAHWWDFFGLDSEHDYDPVWARFRELGYAVTVHAGIGAPPTWVYTSITSWMANHIGSFAAMTTPTCKSLFLGGASQRFPDLPFAFQECGVSWAPSLLADTIGHWEKRNADRVRDVYDPVQLDLGELEALIRRYAPELVDRAGAGDLAGMLDAAVLRGSPPENLDEWVGLDVSQPADFVAAFAPNFYFGCEADDKSVSYAYGDPELKPMLGSDISHFDVPDFAGVVPEAYELVEHGALTAQQFRRFACDNAVEMLSKTNPAFFDGTRLQGRTGL